MQENEREKTDPTYRPWSWLAGFAFGIAIMVLMFQLALSIG
ncbi:MAG: hypothetical protein AAGF49_09870 [Pseudomonadota bacterium]